MNASPTGSKDDNDNGDGDDKNLAPGYIVLIVALVLVVIVGSVYFIRKYRLNACTNDIMKTVQTELPEQEAPDEKDQTSENVYEN